MESGTSLALVRMQDRQTGGFLDIASVRVYVAVDGPFARTSLILEFQNHLGRSIEADLVFPLPPSAALSELVIRLGGRSIEGKIRPRGRAQAEYRRAVEAGQSAVLGETEGDDLARVRVAPVEPGERVEVTLVLHHLLDPINEGHRLLVPLTYMPRFIEDPSGTSATAMAAENRPRPAMSVARATVLVRVLKRHGQSPPVRCASHASRTEETDEYLIITVGPTPLDSDLHLDVLDRPEGANPVVWFCHDARSQPDGLGEATAAAILPPLRPGGAIPRSVTFLVDRSGSMKGAPMVSALQAVRESLPSLTEADRFNILAFDDRVEALADRPVPWTAASLAAAERFLSGIDARGGTRASDALMAALDEDASRFAPMLHEPSRPDARHRLRLVVFMTDGDVAGTAGVLSAAREKLVDTRIHVLGIGPAVHHGMLGEIARIGGGTYEPVASGSDLPRALRSLSSAIQGPVWTGIEVTLREGAARRPPLELEPAGAVDLFAGRPVLFAWRGPLVPGATLVLSGQGCDGDVRRELPLAGGGPGEGPSAAVLWALLRNRRLAYRFDSRDDPALEDLGTQFGLVNRAVALVGVDPEVRDAVVQGSVPVALPLPTQVSAPKPAPVAAKGKMISLGAPRASLPSKSGFINYMSREIVMKFVLCGPVGAGKATAVTRMSTFFPETSLEKIDDPAGRMLFFDASLPQVNLRGFHPRVYIATVTGWAYSDSRKLALKGADGVLFLADSSPESEESNLESLETLEAELKELGMDGAKFPLVLAYNKRDLGDAMPIPQMRSLLNTRGVPDFEVTASQGLGLLDAFKGLLRLALDNLPAGK